jgi:PPE-repeat protein
MDFGALAPEINSGRMYSGPGSAPLLAAATAWDGLASELQFTSASYQSAISELTSTGWQGPSSTSMAAAAAPYAAWLTTTAAQAEQAALQAKAAAGAYETAFAATVPPPLIAANRALLAALIATNFFGQNTSAIAATEAAYAEFWAQDAAAMYAYAGSSATASQLTSFTEPPTTTNGSAAVTQSAAAGSGSLSSILTDLQTELTSLIAQLQSSVQTLSTNVVGSVPAIIPSWTWSGFTDISAVAKSLTNVINTVSGPYTPLGVAGLIKNWYQVSISVPNLGVGIQGIGPLTHPKGLTGVLSPLLRSELLTGSSAPHPSGVGAVSGVTGRAGLIGSLSVPPNWASAVPAVRMAAMSMPEAAVEAAPEIAANGQMGTFGQTALSSLAGRAFGDTATRSVARPASRAIGNVPRFTDGVVVEDIATTATIIVIPPNAE